MNHSLTRAEVISIMDYVTIRHPETNDKIHVYTVGYVTQDGRAGESVIYLDEEDNAEPVVGRIFNL